MALSPRTRALAALAIAAPISASAFAAALAAPAEKELTAALTEVDGPELRRRIAAIDAELVVVNLWATWCAPCKEEFPDLLKIERDFATRGVRLLFVSTDFEAERPSAVRFLREQGAKLPSLVQTGSEDAFIRSLDAAWSGAIPATFVFDRRGKIVLKVLRKVDYDELSSALKALLSKRG